MDHNPQIQVDVTDTSEFHCFRLTLNPEFAPGQRIEIMFHARSLVDLIHKCSIALCDWQHSTTSHLLTLLPEAGMDLRDALDDLAHE
jgi:hypothetical protein